MNKNVSDQEIFMAALEGVNNAFRKYYKWSNGWWNAPESFIESEIANSLSKIVPYITLQDYYPHTIGLSKPLFFLKSPISFEDLKTLKPEPEYVNNCRRSVTRFSKKEAKKIFELMIEKNPEIKKIF